jgi:hypothetical protein
MGASNIEIVLADFIAFKEQQVQLSEQMAAYLRNIEACMEVVLITNNFFDLNKSTLHGYFSVLSDFIQQIIRLNRKHLAPWK